MKKVLLKVFVAMTLIIPGWSTMVHAQQPPTYMHEEREDHRQEDVVTNMHFADDILKNKFLVYYVPYQQHLFKIEHGYRDLVNEYLDGQANGKVIPGPKARELLTRGLKIQHDRNENLNNYIEKLKKNLPGGVALQAWIVEAKLHAASASAYLANVPFVQQ